MDNSTPAPGEEAGIADRWAWASFGSAMSEVTGESLPFNGLGYRFGYGIGYRFGRRRLKLGEAVEETLDPRLALEGDGDLVIAGLGEAVDDDALAEGCVGDFVARPERRGSCLHDRAIVDDGGWCCAR